jgi:hypothetical protein
VGAARTQTAGVVFEQRYNWGPAYRDGQLVCARVQLTVGRDGRLGLTRAERRYVVARFSERVHPALRAELTALARRRGAAARRDAEGMAPIEVVFEDRHLGRQRIVGWVQPPQVRRGDLRDIEFGLREPSR